MRHFVDYEDGIVITVWKSETDPFEEILPIMNEAHDFDITVEWLENKLSWGRGGIATIAWDNGSPIGIALLGAAPYVRCNQPAEILLSQVNFVANEYRHRGVYRRLLGALNEACKAENFDLALTYPNHKSRPGFVNAGWKAFAPMQAYVRIPLSWNIITVLTRTGKMIVNRRAAFEPSQSDGLGPRDFALMASRSEDSRELQYSQSEVALLHRFNRLRGPWYHAIHGDNASAIVRVGRRGTVSEVQFLTTIPRKVDSNDLRELLRLVQRRFEPDMITRIESRVESNRRRIFASGFIRLRQITIPFWRSFQGKENVSAPILSGIDLHRW